MKKGGGEEEEEQHEEEEKRRLNPKTNRIKAYATPNKEIKITE